MNDLFLSFFCLSFVFCFAQFVEQNLVRVPSRPLSGKKYKTKKSQRNLRLSLLGAENESLSICSPLCISSNYLCPVLYSQFEGHLGCFKVSFLSPTFAIQTPELQLLTTNLRIIFEITKSKRDGLYL